MVTLKPKMLPETVTEQAPKNFEQPLTARELKHDLGGSYDERLKAEKTVFISIKQGEKPEVVYTGFWNGKMVHIAQNALARAYRGLVYKNMRANPTA